VTTHFGRFVCVALLVLTADRAAAQTTRQGPVRYVVVVSRQTQRDPEWRKVAGVLVRKYKAETIAYTDSVEECLPRLKRVFPRHACFLARPQEATRRFVVDVHRLTRKLDDDPYTDVMWGILTGYRAEDALRIASAKAPLIIRKGGAGTALDLRVFDEGKWFSEAKAGVYWEKKPGGEPEKKTGPADSTKGIVDFLNKGRPDLFVTSGHATDRDWQIGYSYRNGQFRCRDGKLFGVDLKGKVHPIHSPNPKVFLGAGNCLIGRIRGRQSMALGWLGSGGANQMVGYTVSTWYGAMGWGTKDRLLDMPGRYTLAEAFFFTNQCIVYRLIKRHPESASVEFDRFDMESDRRLLGSYAARLGHRKWDKAVKDHLGLLWDRDTVAFYGDPAWEARLKPREPPLSTDLSHDGGTYKLTVRVRRACKPAKPLAMFLPHRVRDVKLLAGRELEPLITDNFILLMSSGPFKGDTTHEVVFEARRVPARLHGKLSQTAHDPGSPGRTGGHPGNA